MKNNNLLWQMIIFSIVGVVNTVVGATIAFSILYMKLSPIFANTAGFAGGLCTSFTLNRRWTFGSAGKNNIQLISRFLLVVAVSYLFNLTVVIVGNDLSLLNAYIIQIAAMIVYTTTSFLGFKLFTFR